MIDGDLTRLDPEDLFELRGILRVVADGLKNRLEAIKTMFHRSNKGLFGLLLQARFAPVPELFLVISRIDHGR